MKLSLLKSLLALVLFVGTPAQAGIYTYSGSSYSIPDGNPAGVFSQISVSGALSSLSDITVSLNVSGGYNGDLYAYLSYDGVLVPLLNRVGVSAGNPFGSGDSGFNITLVSSGYGNIHAASAGGVGTPLSGTYLADGQNISPLSAASSFNANGGSITLDNTFQGMNPNGTWTLFFADVSAGGGTSTLNGWSLDITAVPEPVNIALGIFGGVCVAGLVVRSRPVRDRLHRWRVAVDHWIDAV
jgi:hypothetical protein